MTQSLEKTQSPGKESLDRSSDVDPAPARPVNTALVTPNGTTTIADGVVSKIAGLAAREIDGVFALGGGAARTIGALRERIPGGRTNVAQGVSVDVGDNEALIDVSIIAEYGVAIADLAAAIRRNVISAVERMTGMDVRAVDVNVLDIHLPEEDSVEDQ